MRAGDSDTKNGGVADGAARIYRERCDRLAGARNRMRQRSRVVGHARLIVFVAGALALTWLLTTTSLEQREQAGAVVLVLLAIFVALALHHDQMKRRVRWSEELWSINDEGAKRAAHDWSALPVQDPFVPPPSHPFAADLDLFGRASVSQLLGPVGTSAGLLAVRRWLLEPAPPSEIAARQEAVRELAPLADLRDELAAHGRAHQLTHAGGASSFLEWAEGEPWLHRRPLLLAAIYAIPALTLAAIILRALGVVDAPLWAIPVVLAGLLTAAFRGRTSEILDRASGGYGPLRSSSGALRLLSRHPFRSARLRDLQRALGTGNDAAHLEVRRLERLSVLADSRLNMFHLLFQLLLLWDFHVALAFERWQRRAGRRARAWLDILGEAEALASFATLAHDNPDWAFPEVAESAPPRLEARALAHPLIARDQRMANDVTIGPPGTFLLVTGSNMSGKSTLLRAVGVNAVLAHAGAPVCAATFRLPPLAVYTSMRVQDSLERGVSHFMAELERLKDIVCAARAAEGSRTVLYLLDEILQGTNTAERQIAARRVIGYLTSTSAIGAVTTHDLTLTDTPELSGVSHAVHFTETVREDDGRPAMTFDYALHPGIATSVNALRLMRIIGLDSPSATALP